MKPFLKWAGGKRWLVEKDEFVIPSYSGRYIEPFLGSGAVFFHHQPEKSILSDLNPRLIETYKAIREDWETVWRYLTDHQKAHSKEYYYQVRTQSFSDYRQRAAHFLYLNRACWNGLYRENLKGEFNVPIGTKTKILLDDDNFENTSKLLAGAELRNCDFELTIDSSVAGDFIFIDPPYTTAHNMNGFVKYNQRIFSWDDQVRLRDAVFRARARGAKILITNADHTSVNELYKSSSGITSIKRPSIIAASSAKRGTTSEILIEP
ncbi:Dam family site-specific DNA-(adenine-N6)-methyltransferase [Rhizobium leguminosarum]|nr:Dam family site-specific DNA-(adenine-N6)-methyltransferase [Rhizobium leguminosarum]TAV56207.1 Dam family site-specific DNA-(adenine-N6)-methyltransferase [Rhizobium leguminosarum]